MPGKDGRFTEPGRLPSAEQALMLRAALLPGVEGIEAAKTWLASADIDRLGKASRGLLPLLYQRFRRDGIEDPLMPTLKGVKRHTWYNNRLLFHHGAAAVRILEQAGIEVMLLKGAALVAAYLHDGSMRPMEDLDLLVRHRDARSAVTALRRQGWIMRHAPHRSGQYLDDGLYTAAKGCHFVHASGIQIDLHWNLTSRCLGPHADDDFWAASRDCRFEGQDARVLHPADQLLHVVIHGAPWSTISPIRWIPDAMVVLRHHPDPGWDRLVAQASARDLSLMVGTALRHLEGHFAGTVPHAVIAALDRVPRRLFERLEHWELTRAGPKGLVRSGVSLLCDHLRESKDRSMPETVRLIPTFLKRRAGSQDLARLASAMTRKVWRHLSAPR